MILVQEDTEVFEINANELGLPGINGESAYQYAIRTGKFVGTEEDWYNSIVGGAFNANTIESLPIFESEIEAVLLPNFTPYRTSTGEVRFKLPTSTDPLLWSDLAIWNDTLTWND